MASRMDPGLLKFWDRSRGHDGDPKRWSTQELQEWLDEPSWLDCPRSRLVEEVMLRLDKLYQDFSPTYSNVTTNINLATLSPWKPLERRAVDTSLAPGSDFLPEDREVLLDPPDRYVASPRSTVVLLAR